MSAAKQLIVLLGGKHVGTLTEEDGGHRFAHDSQYRACPTTISSWNAGR